MPRRKMEVSSCAGLIKGKAIWLYSENDNSAYPIAYLRKPKHLAPEQFEAVCRGLELFLPEDFEELGA